MNFLEAQLFWNPFICIQQQGIWQWEFYKTRAFYGKSSWTTYIELPRLKYIHVHLFFPVQIPEKSHALIGCCLVQFFMTSRLAHQHFNCWLETADFKLGNSTKFFSTLTISGYIYKLYFLSTKKDTIICINNIIPSTNLSVKLDKHFIHSTTREIQIYFCSCMANYKRKFKLLTVLNFHLVWNTSRYCLFVFMVIFRSSFGSRSERPCVLQLLIKMLIRCLMWEGLVLLYRNFLFNGG